MCHILAPHVWNSGNRYWLEQSPREPRMEALLFYFYVFLRPWRWFGEKVERCLEESFEISLQVAVGYRSTVMYKLIAWNCQQVGQWKHFGFIVFVTFSHCKKYDVKTERGSLGEGEFDVAVLFSHAICLFSCFVDYSWRNVGHKGMGRWRQWGSNCGV